HTRSDRDWSSDVCSSDLSQDHRIFPVKKRLQFLDAIDVHDRRAANPHEFPPFEALLHSIHRFAMQMRLIAYMQAHVIVRRFNPRSEERRVGKECRSMR